MFFRSGEKGRAHRGSAFCGIWGRLWRGRDRDLGGACWYSRRLTPYGQAPLGLEGSSAFRRSGSKGSKGSKGGGIALSGDEYEVSVTGFTFSTIWYDKYSADWLAALPPIRLRRTSPRESVSHDSQRGGKVVAPAIKGGLHFLARRAVVWFSPPKAV